MYEPSDVKDENEVGGEVSENGSGQVKAMPVGVSPGTSLNSKYRSWSFADKYNAQELHE